jgi:hypothetical protein
MYGICGDWSGIGRVHRIHTREILREHEVKRPIESYPKFLFEPRQLTKVNGTPQPPRYKPREVDAKNIGDASSAADRGELAYGRKTKSAPSPAQNDRGKIIGEYPCFAQRVLRRRRMVSAFSVRDCSTVSSRPYVFGALSP